jgi:predicted nuclease of restriction endonuclease-like RecB superfamily
MPNNELGVSKKIKKPIKPGKLKKPNHEKILIKLIKIFKKTAGSDRFRFYKDETGQL